MTREQQLEGVLRNLLASIDLHTDYAYDLLERSGIDPAIVAAEQLLAGREADETQPANAVTSAPAIVFYPAGSLGEAVEA